MLSITSNLKASLPLSMVSIPAPTSTLSNTSQTILTSSSKNISLRNQRKLHQFKHSLSISCGVTPINQIDEFSAWKSLRTPHPAFPTLTQHARLTQQVHVGQQVSQNTAETNTYTVLVLPPKNVIENLEEVMKILRSEYGAPELVPHFTVVGPNEQTDDTDAKTKFQAACKGVKPFYVTVDYIETGPSFYECVYCLLQKSEEVLETAAHCSKYFGDDINNPYMRHVSLIFGDFTDEVKQKIKKRAEELCPDLTSLSFQTSKLILYRINMDDITFKSWRQIDEYNLI